MKPINIYTLTRIQKPADLQRFEKQLSKRSKALKIKEWEIAGLKALAGQLYEVTGRVELLQFYYSFVMPKLGKEFDLLRVSEEWVVNIEIKSGQVSDEVIKKQLLQNRYYLATLGKTIYSYTYVSNQNRLLRLSNSGNLHQATWQELSELLEKQTKCNTGHIEELFKEDKYLISPLSDPGRFLRKEYFLTSQQRDIKRHILKRIQQEKNICQGFTGLPGTGKTILLYDIAMQLSVREKVCVFHYGSHAPELEQLNRRLKRIDFFYCESGESLKLTEAYSAILVDEGHRLTKESMDEVLYYADKWQVPVVFSYDCEDSISPLERTRDGAFLIEQLPGFEPFHLTNRIRVNGELSSFIHLVMHMERGKHRKEFPSVSLAYANNDSEAEILLQSLEKEGYILIWDQPVEHLAQCVCSKIESDAATCKEFDRVMMVLDASFFYDEKKYLRCDCHKGADRTKELRVRKVFHGLSRAKESMAVLVVNNEPVFEMLLSIVGGIVE